MITNFAGIPLSGPVFIKGFPHGINEFLQTKVCNGIDDCRKGSDERECDTIVTTTTPKPPKGGCNPDLEFECSIDYMQR